MKVEYFKQGSEEWKAARVGIHTGSQFDALITPLGKLKKGDGPETYLNRLISECLTGEREETPPSYWMKRGIELEPEARDTFEALTGIELEEVGIIYLDDSKQVGVSPDGISFEAGTGLEIKCPSPAKHVTYLRGGVCPKEYVHQCQGAMMVTGFESWYFMSYHPDIKPFIIEVKRDEEYINTLKTALDEQVKIKLTEVERLGN